MLNKSTEDALKIFAELIKGEEINTFQNKDFLDSYELESEVAADIDNILEYFDCELYQGVERGIYISPLIDNKIFGYKNEELKKLFKVDSNLCLYLCYFIMSTIITMFYKDDTGIQNKEYISIIDIYDEVEKRINILKEGLTNNTVSEDVLLEEEGCNALINLWLNELKEQSLINNVREYDQQNRGKTKLAYVNKTLEFCADMGLIAKDSNTKNYWPLERLKTIISQAYKETKNLEYLNTLFTTYTDLSKGGEEAVK